MNFAWIDEKSILVCIFRISLLISKASITYECFYVMKCDIIKTLHKFQKAKSKFGVYMEVQPEIGKVVTLNLLGSTDG